MSTNNDSNQITQGVSPKIKLSVSTQCFTKKPEKSEVAKITFSPCTLSLREFADRIKQGYCFCHWFNTNSTEFGLTEKKIDNFIGANVVFIDIDGAKINMKDYLTTISLKPTLYYTTFSNGVKKSNDPEKGIYCYRLCYVFNDDIKKGETYKKLCYKIEKSLLVDVPNIEVDKHCFNASQYMNGNGCSNIEIGITDTYYSISQFDIQTILETPQQDATTVQFANKTKIKLEEVIQDKVFIADYTALDYRTLRDKYINEYPRIEHTAFIEKEGYYLYPEDYTMIRRPWRWDSFIKSNGEVVYSKCRKKYGDGERRRYKLFVSCLIRRQIYPEITFEHLLFNLIIDREEYYDYHDGTLSLKCLCDIAFNAYCLPLSEISLKRYRPHEYKVDKEYCLQNGISPNSYKNTVRGLMKEAEIGEVYDFNMSVKENLVAMRQMGIKVGQSTLYKWYNKHKPQ